MTTKTRLVLVAISTALVISTLGCGVAGAQKAVAPSDADLDEMAKLGVGPGAQRCSKVQRQVDGITDIYRSNLTDEEKMVKLSAIWAQSAADMKKSAEGDEDIEAAMAPQLFMLEGLAGQLRTAAAAGQKQPPAEVKAAFERVKTMTDSYVKMMRLMCPKLSLPPMMGK